jgi:hypothetical protein
MRRDLLQWDQALTLADRYGTVHLRTNIYSPPSQWRLCTSAEICSSGTWHSGLPTGMEPFSPGQYRQSFQPVEALHMRRDLLQWD